MKFGDFTELAKFYVNRPGYSLDLLNAIKAYVAKDMGDQLVVADVGAGTGKLTENLEQIGLRGYAVEPNDAMRAEGEKIYKDRDTFVWSKGFAEKTGLKDESVDWVLMGSSFHWTDSLEATKEFKRILKPGGFFTAIWNPRDLKRSELHMKIEDKIYEYLPNMKRVSSGGLITNEIMFDKVGGFKDEDMLYLEARHSEIMTKERYMNIWRSVNDIRVQAGEEKFQKIMESIEEIIKNESEIEVPYLSRSWTIRLK